MATRMQQRRGTAQQWTDADPILAAGEIGFETDTNQFKIGDGVNHWDDLSYFKNLEDLGGNLDDYILLTQKATANGVATLDSTGNIPMSQLGNIIDGAPALLDTLSEIATAIDEDSSFGNTIINALSTKAPLTSPTFFGSPAAPNPNSNENSTRIATTFWVKSQGYADAATLSDTASDLATAETNITNLQTDLNTAEGNIGTLQTDVGSLQTNLSTAEGNITTLQTDVDNAESAIASLDTRVDAAEGTISTTTSDLSSLTSRVTDAETDIGTINTSLGTAESNISAIQGDLDTAEVSITGLQGDVSTLQSDVSTLQSDVNTAESNISTLQGDLDTAEGTLATVVSDLDTHEAATTSVHGIADTSALATKTYADTAGTNAIASANTYTDTAVSSKAPLASPALTGTPTAPTASVGTNTTQIATTAFVKAEVDAVIAAAPGALNTLDELAAALGDDANYATTVTNALALKAPLASPTFTGTVALPASSSVTLNGTALSTTLDTKANKTADIAQKTGAYTFVSSDVNMIIEYNSASAGTFTIPADNSFWPVGQRLEVLQVAAGQVTIAGGSGVTVNGTPTAKTRTTWSGATIIKRAANTFVVVGDLASS